jgi:hypothetical protein
MGHRGPGGLPLAAPRVHVQIISSSISSFKETPVPAGLDYGSARCTAELSAGSVEGFCDTGEEESVQGQIDRNTVGWVTKPL